MRKHIIQVHLFLIFLMIPVISAAHEIRPGYLEIKENQDHSLNILWKQPLMGEYGVPLHPNISAGWMVDSLASLSYTESYLIKRWMVPKDHAPLDEQTIQIAGLEKTITDVLIEINLLNNVSFTYLVKPIEPFIKLNLSKPSPPPVWEYLQLGIYHIWSGVDHLLFILALFLLVKKRSTLIWTITSFTIAHSITLALATLNIIMVSSAFTEAAIALSIVFLAVEIVRHYKNQDGFAYHYPWIVAFMFGLLHGLGFAGALQDLGLPENNILYALFLFNAGVELGQLAFVFIILFVMAVIRKLNFRKLHWMKYPVPYFIGSVSVFWFIERVIAMLDL